MKHEKEKQDTKSRSSRPRSLKQIVGTPKVIIDSSISDQFWTLHRSVPNKEWSGIVFFDTDNQFKDPAKEVIRVKYFFLLDVGTAASTEFDPSDERYQLFLMENPEIMSMDKGWLHTHHSMNTYFSGTDQTALIEMAGYRENALSIIVNEKKEFIARVASNATLEGIYSIGGQEFRTKEELVVFYECDVTCSHDEAIVNDLGKVIEQKRKKAASRPKSTTSYTRDYSYFDAPEFPNISDGQMALFDTPVSNKAKVLQVMADTLTLGEPLKEVYKDAGEVIAEVMSNISEYSEARRKYVINQELKKQYIDDFMENDQGLRYLVESLEDATGLEMEDPEFNSECVPILRRLINELKGTRIELFVNLGKYIEENTL